MTTSTTTPTIVPILLRHGDVMVTGGHSRLAFHAVPRLLEDISNISRDQQDLLASRLAAAASSRAVDNSQEELDSLLLKSHIAEYLASTRLNINVRQVNN